MSNGDFNKAVDEVLKNLHTDTSLVVETQEPTEDEIEEMKKNFGNLPEWAKNKPLSTDLMQPDPLQGFDVKFIGFRHQPTTYTLDLDQSMLFIERGGFIDDIPHLPVGRIPIPDHVLMTFLGDYKPGVFINKDETGLDANRETAVLRLNFAKDDDDMAYAEIVHVYGANGRKVLTLELAIDIDSVEDVTETLEGDKGAISG